MRPDSPLPLKPAACLQAGLQLLVGLAPHLLTDNPVLFSFLSLILLPSICLSAALGYAISLVGFGWYNQIKMAQIAAQAEATKAKTSQV